MSRFDLLTGGDVLVAKGVSDFGAGANAGAWVSMRHSRTLELLVVLAAGTGTEDVTLVLEQAKDATGTGVKTLPITKLAYKAGADLTAIGGWTRVDSIDRQNPVNSWVSTESGAATQSLAILVRIHEDDLDTANDFVFVRFTMADPGAARNGVAIVIAPELGYQGVDKPSLLA